MAQPADLGGQTLLRPDILFCLIILIAAVGYAFRHPGVDNWRGHQASTDTTKRHSDGSPDCDTIVLRRGYE